MAEKVPDLLGTDRMLQLDGMVIPGGFGERGIEGKIDAVEFARQREIPCLGLCLGPAGHGHRGGPAPGRAGGGQLHASSTPSAPHPVIDLMDDQHNVVDMGGTMRLGSYVRPARARLDRGRRLRVAGRLRTPPPPLRGEPPLQGPARRGRAALLGVVGRRRARRVRRAPRPPLLGGDPGPPRVQEPARPPPSAVPGAAGRGPAPCRRAPAPPPRPSTPTSVPPPEQGFRHLSDEVRLEGWRISIVSAEYEAPDGTRVHRDVVRHPGAVCRRARDRARHGPARAPVPGGGRPRAPRDTGGHPRRRGRSPRDDGAARARRGGGRATPGPSCLLGTMLNSPGFCDEETLSVPGHRTSSAAHRPPRRGGALHRGRRGPPRRRRRHGGHRARSSTGRPSSASSWPARCWSDEPAGPRRRRRRGE